MQEKLTRWEAKRNHTGVFDAYTVMGIQYRSADGEMGWHISSWMESGYDGVHDFWVSGRTFYSVSIHIFYKGTPHTLIEMFGPIQTGIDQAERDAVLKAIAEWEKAQS
jgi:hypothetical protein